MCQCSLNAARPPNVAARRHSFAIQYRRRDIGMRDDCDGDCIGMAYRCVCACVRESDGAAAYSHYAAARAVRRKNGGCFRVHDFIAALTGSWLMRMHKCGKSKDKI